MVILVCGRRRPQLKRISLGARYGMRSRYLIALVLVMITCRTATPVRCLALQWADSTWSNMVPGTVQVAPGEDSGKHLGVAGPFPLKPVSQGDQQGPRWKQITDASWFAVSPDSLVLRFRTNNASWSAYVSVRTDSVRGTIFFSGFDTDGSIPSRVLGHEFACP